MKDRTPNDNKKDYGNAPFAINIDKEVKENPYYRRALWTGKHLQVTLMSIPPRGDIGLEIHPDVDQFIRIESGFGLAKMGKHQNSLDRIFRVNSSSAVFVPSGTWHNIINIGNTPLKLYSVYAPPQHPHGTVHETKKIAEEQGD